MHGRPTLVEARAHDFKLHLQIFVIFLLKLHLNTLAQVLNGYVGLDQ